MLLLIVSVILLARNFRCAPQGLEGPARDLPIMRSDEFLAGDLPMEHRMGGILLPDIFNIPRRITSKLDVDFFLSLYFVFLNNDWLQFQDDCIIFAPAGLDSDEAARWLQTEEELVEELLLSHIILGETIRPELLSKSKVLTTLSGLEVEINLDKSGNLLVNGVPVVSMERHKNILLVSLQDYLFKSELRSQLAELTELQEIEAQQQTTAPRNINNQDLSNVGVEFEKSNPEDNCQEIRSEDASLSIFKKVTVCTEPEDIQTDVTEPEDIQTDGTEPEDIQTDVTEPEDIQTDVTEPENIQTEDNSTLKEVAPQVDTEEIREDILDNDIDITDTTNSSQIKSQARIDLPEESEFATISAAGNLLPLENSQEKTNKRPDLLEQISTLIQFFRGSPDIYAFLDYARKHNLSSKISEDSSFTILAPQDSAFRAWTPIDWGFNPFNVDKFVEQIVLDHVLLNTVDLYSVQEKEYKTLGGNTVKLSVNPEASYVNGVPTLGEIDLFGGKLVFIEDLLFINDNVVQQLNDQFRYLETGPLITFPWIESQFLSHAYRYLSRRADYSYLTVYMNITSDLGTYAPNIYQPDISSRYIILAPPNTAFSKILPRQTENDPFLQDDVRLGMLLDHLIVGNYSLSDVSTIPTLKTVSGKTLNTFKNETGSYISDGNIQSKLINETIFIYNLGMIIPIDSVLFGEEYEIIEEETTVVTTTVTGTEDPATTTGEMSTEEVITFADFLDVFESTTELTRERTSQLDLSVLFPSKPSDNFKILQELNTGQIVAERFVDSRVFENGAILNPKSSNNDAILNPSASILKPFGAILNPVTESSSLGIENLFRKDQNEEIIGTSSTAPKKALRRIDEGYPGSLVNLFYREDLDQELSRTEPSVQSTEQITPKGRDGKKKKKRVVYVNNKRIEIDYR